MNLRPILAAAFAVGLVSAPAMAQTAPAAAPAAADPAAVAKAQADRIKALEAVLAQMQRAKTATQAPAAQAAPGMAAAPPLFAGPSASPAPLAAPVPPPPGTGTATAGATVPGTGLLAPKVEVLKPGLAVDTMPLGFRVKNGDDFANQFDASSPEKTTVLDSGLTFPGTLGGGSFHGLILHGVLVAQEDGDFVLGLRTTFPGQRAWPMSIPSCREAAAGFTPAHPGFWTLTEISIAGQVVVSKVENHSLCDPLNYAPMSARGQIPLSAAKYDVSIKTAVAVSCGPGTDPSLDAFSNQFIPNSNCEAQRAQIEEFLLRNVKYSVLFKRPSDAGIDPAEVGPLGPKAAAFRH